MGSLEKKSCFSMSNFIPIRIDPILKKDAINDSMFVEVVSLAYAHKILVFIASVSSSVVVFTKYGSKWRFRLKKPLSLTRKNCMYALRFTLTHISLASFLWDIGKQ